MLSASPVITRVVLAAATTPTEELETLKFPALPVEIIKGVFRGFPFCPKVTEIDVEKT